MFKAHSDELVAQNLGEANGEDYITIVSCYFRNSSYKENLPLFSEFSRDTV